MKDTLAKWLQESDNIVFFGGAGVSTESNIPDFRSQDGIFKALKEFGQPPEVLLSHTFFIQNPETFYTYYKKYLLYPDAKPNGAHEGLARLEKQGRLKAVVTQNIDGLHQLAGSKKVYELHGSVARNYCMDCRKDYTLEAMLAMSGSVPRCSCGGMIRPDVVLYEEGLDGTLLQKSCKAIEEADIMIVGGTSLNVYPAAGLVNYYNGDKLVLINKSETPYDSKFNLIIREPIGKVFEEIVA